MYPEKQQPFTPDTSDEVLFNQPDGPDSGPQDAFPPDLPDDDVDAEVDVPLDAPAMHFGAVAKTAAVKNLADDLVDKCSYTYEGAWALATAVVDPAALRRQLANLQELRVLGGTFKVAPVRVWANRVIPDPGNFRLVENYASPFLGKPVELRHTAIPEAKASGPAGNELKIEVLSRMHLEAVATAGYEKIRQENPQVMESVPLQGVMMPTFGAVMEVTHKDTNTSVWTITTPDGSSRVSACHHELQITTGEVLYEYKKHPEKARKLVDESRRVAATPTRSLTKDQLTRNRVMTLPMTVLIGFTPDPGSSQDFASAARSLVGLIHVAPPTEWPEAGEREAKAAAVLRAIGSLRSEDELRFMQGVLPAHEAAEAGFYRYLDQRAAYILRTLTYPDRAPHRSLHTQIKNGIRGVLAGGEGLTKKGGKVQETRIQVAMELALRPVREAGALPVKISTVRAALDRAFLTELFKNQPWVPTPLDADELFDEALAEWRQLGKPGPVCCVMAIMGTWWLCATGVLTRAKAQDQEAAIKDWREPAQIVNDLARSEHGLHVFRSAIEAGRKAQDSGTLSALSIPAVTPSGAEDIGGDGKPQAITSNWLRTHVNTDGPKPDNPGQGGDPKAKWNRNWGQFMTQTQSLFDYFTKEILPGTLEGGKKVVEEDGIPFYDTEKVGKLLDEIVKDVAFYGRVSKMKMEALQPDPEQEQDGEENE